ncbi:hypothetical protein UFOVP120_3 [uncultured Caudovirales phage]|uniref:Uncharacterized protein n=1 Tax=uncultured Caudovirales phage TaxID=2100421 RepID=A0A6J5L906_9CAUD|nr:hypothetical protein UFOVP120_3 [uncultured Caudovirales phage]
MATSGTYTFNPSLGELTLYAYNLCGLRNTSLLQEHLEAARMAANMLCANWSNRGVNLWAVDLVTVPLVQGQKTYDVDLNTVTMLDAYMVIDDGNGNPTDRIILPVSRTEYASYPNKDTQGFTTTFWFDRLISPNPTVTLWPVPDGTSAQYLKYYRVRQIQDSNLQNGTQVEIPYLWMDAFAYGLAARLAIIWAPDKAQLLKPLADEAYQIAADQNVETAQQYISPQIAGYYRP